MHDRIDVAFICHPYHRGGVTRWMVDMAVEYALGGANVYFITVEPEKDFLSAGGKETIVSLLNSARGIHVITARVNWSFELGTEAYRASVYEKLLLGKVPPGTPVILSDDPAVWRVASLAGNKYKFIGVLHSDEPKYYELAKIYHPYTGALVCVSNRIKEKLMKACNTVDESKISVIPCGIELPVHLPEKKASDTIRLVFAGRITEYQKRVSDLLKICAGLAEQKIDFDLKIIGDGTDRKKLESECERMGLTSRVWFLGWLSKEEIYNHLFQSDLLLLTSDFEGMPIAVMEALSMGCGIVSTRVSGVEDYEKNSLAENCLRLYTVGNIAEAINHIKNIILIPSEVRSAAAIDLARNEFSMNTCINKYNNVIKTINKPNGDLSHHSTNWITFIYSFSLSFTRYVRYRLVK